jgi:hypothetical protein
MTRKPTNDMIDEVISFRGEIRMSEVRDLKLNKLDRLLMGSGSSSADHLLALEMLFRRGDEARIRETLRPA